MRIFLQSLFDEHPATLLGAGVGFGFGILTLFVGVLAAAFVGICVVAGLILGRRYDADGAELQDLIERFFPRDGE